MNIMEEGFELVRNGVLGSKLSLKEGRKVYRSVNYVNR